MVDVLLKCVLLVGGLTACLMLASGDPSWLAGWALLALYALFVVLSLCLVDRDLLRERASPPQGFDRVDALLASAGFVILYPLLLIVAGLDAERLALSPELPRVVCWLGFALFVAGYAIALCAMVANPYFSTFVRIQDDRDHRLVNAGPYGLVRHPGYAGMLLAHVGIPIALGSLYGLAAVAVGAAVFIVRIIREERTLAASLPGYPEYQARVRWRLLPGVW